MKKVIFFILILCIFAYAMFQNKGRILLFILSPTHKLSLSFGNKSKTSTTLYTDGIYIGTISDAFYGNIQVKTIVQKEKIIDIQFLQYPHDALRSIAINTIAMPNLKQEAISMQMANVDVISGATDTSQAFIQSLQSALNKAKKS